MKRNTFTLLALLTFLAASVGQALGQAAPAPNLQAAAALRLLNKIGVPHPAIVKALTTTGQAAAPTNGLQTANAVSLPGQEVVYSWQNNAWQEDSTLVYTYDQAAAITQEVVLVGGQERKRTLTSFAAPGGPLESITYQTREGGAWQDDMRDLFLYNQTGLFLEHHLEEKQGGNWVQVGGRKRDFVMAGSQVAQITEQEYLNGAWVNANIYLFLYENNNMISITQQSWEEGAWAESLRYTSLDWRDWPGFVNAMLYNPYFTPDGATAFVNTASVLTYDEDEKDYVEFMRISNTNEANGQIVSTIESNALGTWMVFLRTTLTPDSRGNIANLLVESVFSTIENRYTYTYDGIHITERIMEERVAPSQTFVNESRSVYSNHQTFTITAVKDEALAAATKVYPNPTNGQLLIETPGADLRGAKVCLFSLTGQKVMEGTISSAGIANTAVLNLHVLPKGIYQLRVITADNRTVSRKVVRQ